MANPLEDDIWKQIREAYAIVQSGNADEAEVDSPVAYIFIYQDDEPPGTIHIEVRSG